MSSQDQFKIKKTGGSYILYDASIIADPALQLFDADFHADHYHTNQSAQQNNSTDTVNQSGIGRARVIYFPFENKTLVLKHYYRGGAVASVLKDKYLGFRIENTRAFKEWRLLKKMRSLQLPVPEAVAARVERSLLSFRADLITEKIEQTDTLADILTRQKLPPESWGKIGACIKQFHQKNIYHADLNARNILLAADSAEGFAVYLIDFDNSGFRLNSDGWKMANLARLKRSLLKFGKNQPGFCFDEDDWSALLEGYK